MDRWIYIFGMENRNGNGLDAIFSEMLGDAGCPIYKIGTTINPMRRWQQVQVHSPWHLYVIALVKGGFEAEKKIHEYFEEFRTRGEWFEIPEEVMDHVLKDIEKPNLEGKEAFPDLPWTDSVAKENDHLRSEST